MSIEASMYALLAPFVGARVFPRVAPSGTARPYATYQRIGGSVIKPIGREIPNKQNAYVQVNVWSDRALEASTLAQQIEGAFRTVATIYAVPQAAPIDTYEPVTGLYGTVQEFSVWFDR